MSSGVPLRRAVRTYLDHLTVERGLAANTLSSYTRDLGRYDEFLAAQGIDLDHHLMPDPVGKALACLLDRVHTLETLLGAGALARDPACASCIDDCPPVSGAALRADGHRDARPLTDEETALP